MDRLTAAMVRLSLCWLPAGFVIGGAMLVDRVTPGDWRTWMAPSHEHMLFVGWSLQFVVGIAFWLLPRKRTPQRPLGYNECLAMPGAGALNSGLMLRILSEPFERVGKVNAVTRTAFFVSAVLQIQAVLIFVKQLWLRASSRQVRIRPQNAGPGAVTERSTRTNGDQVGGWGKGE
ncbi:cbb3-type cytochrome c oxidase subunit I [soil metagenome]